MIVSDDNNRASATLRVLDIVEGTSVDGPGLRTSVYLAGCTHHCEGCHNPESWDPTQGTVYTVDELYNKIEDAGMNVTFSGGDPLLQAPALIELVERLVEEGGFHVWCYTGYTFEEVAADTSLNPILRWIDVLVDGPFVLSRRDTSLLFRGSGNQRLVDVARWRQTGEITCWTPEF